MSGLPCSDTARNATGRSPARRTAAHINRAVACRRSVQHHRAAETNRAWHVNRQDGLEPDLVCESQMRRATAARPAVLVVHVRILLAQPLGETIEAFVRSPFGNLASGRGRDRISEDRYTVNLV